jgi:hypothetical protein
MSGRAGVASLAALLCFAAGIPAQASDDTPRKEESRTMPSVKQLSENARALVAATLPVETHQSYPIPVVRGGTLRLRFLFCPSIVKPNIGLLLQPPTHVLEIDGRSGSLVELRATSPHDLEQSDDPQKVIGRYDMLPDGRTPGQFLEMQARLYALYDALLPAFAAGRTPGDEARAKQAREFLTLFPKVTEQPLQPYYRVAGAEFFRWLEQQGAR